VTALKFTIVEGPQAVDPYIQETIADFLNLIEDPDRHVRRATVSALSTAAHNKAGLVADHLPGLLPKLYDLTLIKKDLIR
jgi:cullin-associated NEDD8-dissociated protein 1